jgi:hypothetical protein
MHVDKPGFAVLNRFQFLYSVFENFLSALGLIADNRKSKPEVAHILESHPSRKAREEWGTDRAPRVLTHI